MIMNDDQIGMGDTLFIFYLFASKLAGSNPTGIQPWIVFTELFSQKIINFNGVFSHIRT